MVYITTEIPTSIIENGKIKTVRKIGVTNDIKGYKKRLSFAQSFLADKIDVYRAFSSNIFSEYKLEHFFHTAFKPYNFKNDSNARELFCVNADQIDGVISCLKSTSIPDLIELDKANLI